MNKQDLIAKLAKDTGSTKSMAAQAIDSVIDGITKALKKGDSVTFVGFGTFKTSNRKARTARNPQTGADDQDSEAQGRALRRRQGAQERGELVNACGGAAGAAHVALGTAVLAPRAPITHSAPRDARRVSRGLCYTFCSPFCEKGLPVGA